MQTPYAAEGGRFQECRKLLGLTQKEIAEISTIALPTIKQYERGVRLPKISYRRKLDALGFNMNYVLTGEGSPLLPDHWRPKKVVLAASDEDPTQYFLREVEIGYKPREGEIVGSADEIAKVVNSHHNVIQNVYDRLNFRPPHAWDGMFQDLLIGGHIDEEGIRRVVMALIERVDFYEGELAKRDKKNSTT